MGVFEPPLSGRDPKPESAPVADPRLQPTPDYGTLGPGSDIAASGTISNAGSVRQAESPRRFGPIFAAALGVLLAIFVGNIGRAQAAWSSVANLFSVREAAPASAKDSRQLDRMKPQKQAEALLELAVGHSAGAVDQISSRVDRWQGKVKWDSQIATQSDPPRQRYVQ